MSDWIKSFSSQFSDAVCTDDATLTAQAVQGVVPACIGLPDSEAQAAAMIRFAASNKIPVVPCGGGTSQGRCAPPPSGFLALSTKRLNKLIHHEPGDMVATVQGGMTFKEFQDSIRARGQFLPIDALGDATIGGIVAENAHGPRALGYGTLRDMILGMTVINGDGVLRKCGGKVVKNVTGYALDKLYIGSLGTLGLITEVTFKLRPLPVGYQSWKIGMPDITSGIELMRTLSAKNFPLDVLQFYSPQANWTSPGHIYPEIHILACGTDAELDRIHSEIRAILPPERCPGFTRSRDVPTEKRNDAIFEIGQFLGSIWNLKADPVLSMKNGAWLKQHHGDPIATLRFSCVSSKLETALSILEAFKNAPLTITLNGGIIDLAPLSDTEAARIAAEFEKLGVNFAFENIVGVNIPNRWGTPRPEWALMKQLKSALDPHGIMNPGRFVV